MNLPEKLESYVEQFNEDDTENIVNEIPNARAYEWMLARVPLISVPDPEIERAYYFRWWTYRKHIRKTPEGHVLSEFNTAVNLPWGKKYCAISCAAGHHVDEGEWLRERAFLEEYIDFWYDGDNRALHSYGNWLEAAVARLCRTAGDWALGERLLPRMLESYAYMENAQRHSSGLYYSIDDRDGQEYAVGGSGLRPTVNSYMVANARGIAEIARKTGKRDIADEYEEKAETLAALVNALLWDDEARFYKTLRLDGRDAPIPTDFSWAGAPRELIGYLPWRFGFAPGDRADAFSQLLDPDGFYAPVAPPVCEKRHPDYVLADTAEKFNAWLRRFDKPFYPWMDGPNHDYALRRKSGDWVYLRPYHLHACQWNGPSWAYSTALTLGAAAGLLQDFAPRPGFSRAEFTHLLHRYAASHRMKTDDGREVSWIDEAQNPDTGEWMTRKIYYERRKAHPEAEFPAGIDRGKDYNHSTFCDLVLGGLFGVRPEADGLRVIPLFPGDWPYARLENARVGGRNLEIDYSRDTGYRVRLDGKEAFSSPLPTPARLC